MTENASAALTDFSVWLTGRPTGEPQGPAAPSAPSPQGRRYGGLTVLERRSGRRRRLLDAGLELFAGMGYPATTIEGICAEAGVTARHFYEEFGSREELLKAVFDRSVDTTILEVIEAIDRTADATDGFSARLRKGVDGFVYAFLDDPRRARVVCIESVGVSPEMEDHRRLRFHRFSDLLLAEAETGRVGKGDGTSVPEQVLTIRALVGGTSELIADWLLAPDPVPLEVLTRVLSDLYLVVFRYR